MKEKLKNILISIIAPDYFDLKKERESLIKENGKMREDIYCLVKYYHSQEGIFVRRNWELNYEIEREEFTNSVSKAIMN